MPFRVPWCTTTLYTNLMLTPFRRHTGECLNGPEGHPELGLLRRKMPKGQTLRTYTACTCPVWYSGTWNGKRHPRKSTGFKSWAKAEGFCQNLMAGKSEQAAAATVAAAAPTAPETVSLEDALAKWDTASTLKLGESTMANHKLMAQRLRAFCGKYGITQLSEIDADFIELWRTEWVAVEEIRATTHHTRFITLASFFNFAVKRKWLAESPMHGIEKPRQNPASKETTIPLDPEGGEANYLRVLAALGRMASKDPRAGAFRREPARIVALAKLWYETGMRSQDGLRFDTRKAVVDDECAMYEFVPFKTRKYGVVCTTFLSLGLWKELCALTPLSPGHPFWDGLESSIPGLETRAYQLVHEAGEQAFVTDCHPHRFRDSFAVNKLNAGARMEDVSRWLGHTNTRTTEKYYAPWVKSRQDVSRASFLRTIEAPQNVVVMPKTRKQA